MSGVWMGLAGIGEEEGTACEPAANDKGGGDVSVDCNFGGDGW